MRRNDSEQNREKGTKKKFQFTPTPLMIIIGLFGAAFLCGWFINATQTAPYQTSPEEKAYYIRRQEEYQAKKKIECKNLSELECLKKLAH